MKIIAWYLPQFHEIPENNAWWGKGFTEWTNIKKAVAYYKDQYQPRIPLGGNYYNLLDDAVKKWQVDLAKEYGVYGFCMYHYWFDGKLLLEKPVEQYLQNKELDLPFCICWANEHWTTQWKDDEYKILIEQKYGDKQEWEKHFDYLLPFFRDPRYIKAEGKPLFVFFKPELCECVNEMMDYWQQLAVENGLPGLTVAYQGFSSDYKKKKDDSRFTYNIENQPTAAFTISRRKYFKPLRWLDDRLPGYITNSRFVYRIKMFFFKSVSEKEHIYDYDELWNNVLSIVPKSEKSVPGAFVDWDNSPRKHERGVYVKNVTPEKFKKYLTKQILRTKNVYHKDMLFMFAWNEWCEGGYLEPDEKHRYRYLEAIRDALKECKEFPEYP